MKNNIRSINSFSSNDFTNAQKAVFISLFAGCGGSSLGYHKAGFKELLAVEWDRHARKMFSRNFPSVPIEGWDISKINGEQILNRIGLEKFLLDLFDASPPCQDFSRSNTHRTPDTARNGLYFKTLKLIEEIQPKVCVIENVEGIKQGKMRPVWNEIVDVLDSMNYYFEFKLVHAEEHEVPQMRRRVIIVGVRKDIHERFGMIGLFPSPSTDASTMNVAAVLPHLLGYSPGQFADNFHMATRPMCTITKTASAWVYEYDGIRRKPTIAELKALSSFPDDFTLTGKFGTQWARIGNAVPPNITKAIGHHIKNHILTEEVQDWCNGNEYRMAA